jgi:hypothetical protein
LALVRQEREAMEIGYARCKLVELSAATHRFCDIDIERPSRNIPHPSTGFRRWLARLFFETTQGAPSSEALQSAKPRRISMRRSAKCMFASVVWTDACISILPVTLRIRTDPTFSGLGSLKYARRSDPMPLMSIIIAHNAQVTARDDRVGARPNLHGGQRLNGRNSCAGPGSSR